MQQGVARIVCVLEQRIAAAQRMKQLHIIVHGMAIAKTGERMLNALHRMDGIHGILRIIQRIVRGGGHVLYIKQSDMISDFLTFLGAPLAAMGIMEARLEKELNNKVNRRCNCDEANTSKVVEAAQEHLATIRLLRERGKLEHLPQKLQQAAKAREENPSASLTELAAMMEPPITKPAMNHRLKKLLEAAKEI